MSLVGESTSHDGGSRSLEGEAFPRMRQAMKLIEVPFASMGARTRLVGAPMKPNGHASSLVDEAMSLDDAPMRLNRAPMSLTGTATSFAGAARSLVCEAMSLVAAPSR